MEINKHEIKYKGQATIFNVVPLGDIHLGNACCDIDKCKEMITWIKDTKNTYWIGMGDYIDCINYTDKRFDPDTVSQPYASNLANSVSMQIEDMIKILTPIKNKCLGLHRGNHEESIRLRYHFDVLYEMWKAFKVPMLKDAAITRLAFQKTTPNSNSSRCAIDIFSMHGRVGGYKGGYKINRLEDYIGYIDADVYLMGHSHIKETETKSVLFVDNQLNLKNKKRILAVTGCFMNGYHQGISSYVEKGMYPPTDTGVVKVIICPFKRDIHISE